MWFFVVPYAFSASLHHKAPQPARRYGAADDDEQENPNILMRQRRDGVRSGEMVHVNAQRRIDESADGKRRDERLQPAGKQRQRNGDTRKEENWGRRQPRDTFSGNRPQQRNRQKVGDRGRQKQSTP